MKETYSKPEIYTEILLKEDVLMISKETENQYRKSRSIFNDDFLVDSIL